MLNIELVKNELIDCGYDCWLKDDNITLFKDGMIFIKSVDKVNEMFNILTIDETVGMLITMFKIENKEMKPISMIDLKNKLDNYGRK